MKVGSVHIKNCFTRLGYRPATTHIARMGCYNEEHMIEPHVCTALSQMGGIVIQQHVRAIGPNVAYLQDCGLKPVVLHRAILDSLVSWEESSHGRAIKKGHNPGRTFASLYIPDWTTDRSKYDRQKWCIYNVLPWFLSFYVSWREADIEKLFVRYDQHFKDQVEGMLNICRFATPNHMPSREMLEKVTQNTDRGGLKFGVSGRGVKELPQDLIDTAIDQARSWGQPWGPVLARELF
jgi:hypothetical protein